MASAYSSLIPIVFILLKGTQFVICESQLDSGYRKLREQLKKDYDPNTRPVLEHSQTTVVTFSLAPTHIADMDEKHGTLRIDVFASMTWADDHLKWNPEEFFGIKKVHFKAEEVWKPDLKLLNGRAFTTTPWMYGGLSVNSSGIVSWYPAVTVYPICQDFDYRAYPNDVQKCQVRLGSWTATQKDIDFQIKHTDWIMYYYNRSNPHWEITNFEGRKLTIEDTHKEAMEYDIEMKRINVPHVSLGSVPDTVARILLLCMFWLPDLTKKLFMGLTSVFILTLIAVSINDSLPSPAAAIYALTEITAALVMGVMAIILEIILSSVANWRGAFPSFLSGLTNMRFFQALSSCAQKEQAVFSDCNSGSKELAQADGAVKVRLWTVLALLIERILFVIFCVLLLAV